MKASKTQTLIESLAISLHNLGFWTYMSNCSPCLHQPLLPIYPCMIMRNFPVGLVGFGEKLKRSKFFVRHQKSWMFVNWNFNFWNQSTIFTCCVWLQVQKSSMLTSQVAKHPVNKLSKMDYFYLTWLEWVLLEEVDLIQGICEPLLSNFHDSLSLELFLFSFP